MNFGVSPSICVFTDIILSDIHPWFDQNAILVSFEIHALSRLKRETTLSLSVAESVTYLKQLVEDDTLDFVPPVGLPIPTDPDSFEFRIIVDPRKYFTKILYV